MNHQIEILPVLSDNYAYLLGCADGAAAVIDPPVVEPILEAVAARGWRVEAIVATHHHPDHVGGIESLKAELDCPVYGPSAEADRIPGLDHGLGEGDEIRLGGSLYSVIETPGHTAGHVCLHSEEAATLFSADTLFVLGCGRLFEGTAAEMWASLCKLRALPDDTRVYCGHEYTVANARFACSIDPENAELIRRAEAMQALRASDRPTVPALLGDEKATNPFLRADDPLLARGLGLEDRAAAAVFGEIRRRKDES